MDTKELINTLSKDATLKSTLKSPCYFTGSLIIILIIYAVIIQFFLKIRPDFFDRISSPLFLTEIILLLSLAISSVFAAVISMYPDIYQKRWALKIPYLTLILLMGFILAQLILIDDLHLLISQAGSHGIECTICIAEVSLIPSCLIFGIIRKGSSVTPYRAGSYAALTSTAVGCLTLRIAEANDSLQHLITFHYLPIFVFTAIGAIIGKWLFKW